MSEEAVFVTSATGGTKGQKRAQLSSVDPLALLELAKVSGMGAAKYARGNYLRGYAWSLSMDALYRHFLAWQSGEDVDPESGHSHMAHVAWQALALVSFQLRAIGTDDRLPPQPTGKAVYEAWVARGDSERRMFAPVWENLGAETQARFDPGTPATRIARQETTV